MTSTDVEIFHQWRMGYPSADPSKCPGCKRPYFRNPDNAPGRHLIHADDCAYMAWVADEHDTLDVDACTCYEHSVHSPGSVASIRAGDTDLYCPVHGHEDVISGAYGLMSDTEQRRWRAAIR